MTRTRITLFIIIMMICLLSSYSLSYALFNSTATNGNNTFIAASTFPSTTLTPTATNTPTPTNAPTPTTIPTPGPGDVVINEINWAGNNAHTSDEWVELRNITGNTIDLSNWTISSLGAGAASITIPSGKSIGANSFFLLSNLSATDGNSILNITPDVISTSISLDNNGEQLVLRNGSSQIIDIANRPAGVWWKGSNTIPKKSMERNAIPGDGTLVGSWHDATTSLNLDASATESATPRATNSL